MFDFFKRDAVKSVNVNDMDDLIGKVELIDIREPYEFRGGTLRTAKNIPMGNLLQEPDKYLKKGNTYYLVCQSGGRSGSAANALLKQGFDIVNVSGGVGSYAGTKRA